ncbi:MAG: triose-phosphate isomerase [Vampirovibrionales bacterium]|nr:triose-phosphate isomerase [Vampirovibrionales bacterium]
MSASSLSLINSSRPLVIAANWKLYKTLPEASQFLADFEAALVPMMAPLVSAKLSVLLCPTALVLGALSTALTPDGAALKSSVIQLGAQNVAAFDEGAYTGELSAKMLAAQGIRWVIIGHSERRQYFGETDASVNQKVTLALAQGLTPIVCVGETLVQRDAGDTDTVVRQQVKASIEGLSAQALGTLVFAYEPVWAIGTGKTCDASEANRVCGLIRAVIAEVNPAAAESVRIQYGGSVKPDNALELLSQPDIDGALVGGASLDPVAFAKIIQAAVASSQKMAPLQEDALCQLS